MEQEFTLVKEKCNQMVTSAMPPPFERRRQRKLDHFFLINNCSTNYIALSMIIITSHYLSTHTQIWVNIIRILVQFLVFAKSA